MIARIGCLLAALVVLPLAMPAAAQVLHVDGFAPPLLDGVVPAPQATAADGLSAYRFAGGRDWPALRFTASVPLQRQDAAALAIPVDNAADEAFTLLVRLDDDPRADGGDHSLTGLVTLAPHARGTVVLPLVAGPTGMRGRPTTGGPTRPGDLPVTDLRGTVDTAHIVALHLSGTRAPADRVLRLGVPQWRTAATGTPARGPIADGFGQAIAGDWPEKVRDDADLRAKLAAAATQTARLARMTSAAAEAAGRATGFFRVEKAEGRWRFVSPEGRPFFSLGVDAVTPANPTIVAGRAGLFQGLPATGTVLGGFYAAGPQGRSFDVGAANLMRAYGPDWRARWDDEAIRRLKAWGFNTLGNWSEASLAARGLASVTFYDVEGASAMVPMEGGRSLPDPFDPRYRDVADAVAGTMTAAHAGDPALLGYFSGNEMPWGSADKPASGIAAHVLALGPTSDAKRAFLADLRARYGSVGAWAAAWGIAAPASWERLAATPRTLAATLTPDASRDVAAFQRRFADAYFSTVAQAIRRHDPHHLYLGTRFAAAPPEVVAACARWCDVLSFNVYGASPAEAAARWRAYDRPVLIGEFHFGSLDRGSYWPGMVDAGADAARGPAYAAYLDGARQDPAIVGVHWYQYADEPLTGRPYDGENGHIGLVAVTDVPYAGFVEAVAAANRAALRPFVRRGPRDATRTIP